MSARGTIFFYKNRKLFDDTQDTPARGLTKYPSLAALTLGKRLQLELFLPERLRELQGDCNLIPSYCEEQNAEYMFWQKTNNPIKVYSPYVFDQKIEYIHNNPVMANIVTDPTYYFYSSANPLSPLLVDEY